MKPALKLTISAFPVLFGALLLPSLADASSGTGQINNLTTTSSGWAYFMVAGAPSTLPCSADGRYVINIITPAGQAMLAQLLTAYSSGRPTFIQGSGVCGSSVREETVAWITSP